jgi:hypothetical protein
LARPALLRRIKARRAPIPRAGFEEKTVRRTVAFRYEISRIGPHSGPYSYEGDNDVSVLD